jgi:hypothetical protein
MSKKIIIAVDDGVICAIQKLSNLQTELTKFLTGNLNFTKLVKGLNNVESSLEEIKYIFSIEDLDKINDRINKKEE